MLSVAVSIKGTPKEIAANPDVAEKVRGGKLPAVGVLVGSVMKATRGQADAATVKAILLDRLGVSETG